MIDFPGGLIAGVVVALISGLLSALLTMIFMYLRGTRAKLEEQCAALSDLEKTLPLDYVRREDFVRWTIKVDKKLDDLNKTILQEKGSCG